MLLQCSRQEIIMTDWRVGIRKEDGSRDETGHIKAIFWRPKGQDLESDWT